MGNALFRTENARIEEFDSSPNTAYRFPTGKGNYFGSHYIMAGERFETTQPEAYLFGDNMDLNFLGGRPTPFPYPAPQPNEPTHTLRSFLNIRKESLRFVKAPDISETDRTNDTIPLSTTYNIEFSFDTDVRCAITIYYFCTEEVTSNCVVYTSKHLSMNSETYHYKKGGNQQFSQVSHVFDPSKYSDDMLMYKFEDDVIPILIQCVAEEGEEPRQSQAVIASVERNVDGTYTLKPLKQKLFVDGLYYLIQEIYGIENKNIQESKNASEEDVEDSGSECVICINDARDTLILPCRHLCLCNNCADSLRYAANNCPICRAPFRALLQIKAVRKSIANQPQVSQSTENQPSQDVPPGYEPVSLIEALNGPMQPSAHTASTFVSSQIHSFSSNLDIHQKERHLERHSSSTSICQPENPNSGNPNSALSNNAEDLFEESPASEVVNVTVMSSKELALKNDSVSLVDCRKHRKGFRSSSATEKMRLLANSVQIVNETGCAKRKIEKDVESAETKSLLANSVVTEEISPSSSLAKTSNSCNQSDSIATTHSQHLGEKSSTDFSPRSDDSDYYTPEDPNRTILVDQSTDTYLDTSQSMEMTCISDFVVKDKKEYSVVGKYKVNQEKHSIVDEDTSKEGNLPIHDKRKKHLDS